MRGNEEGLKRTPVSQARGQRQIGASGYTANIQGAEGQCGPLDNEQGRLP